MHSLVIFVFSIPMLLASAGELSVAMPLLEMALKALDTLTKADITEVKAMKSPPAAVKVVMEVVCLMLGTKPNRVNDPSKPGGKVNDYWGPAQVRSYLALHVIHVQGTWIKDIYLVFSESVCPRKCMSHKIPNLVQDIHLGSQEVACLISLYD